MTSETRLATVLLGSFLLAFPALGAFLRGDIDGGAVGMRFAGAAALTWVAITLVSSIVTGYRSEPVLAPVDVAEQPRRRAEDPPTERMSGADPLADTPAPPVSDASGG